MLGVKKKVIIKESEERKGNALYLSTVGKFISGGIMSFAHQFLIVFTAGAK